jgi:peroxiredoxin
MKINCAPEFRGKIRTLSRRNRPQGLAWLFLTKKVSFQFAFAIAFSVAPVAPSGAAAAQAQLSPIEPAACRAPFALPGLDGRRHTLAEARGQPVLVHFFATWCEPCKAELSSLDRLVQARAGEIAVLAVSVGEPPRRLRRFFAETPVTFPVLVDEDRAVAKSWAVDGLPATVVLDTNLTPRLSVTGDLDWGRADVGRELDRVLAHTPGPQDTTCAREATQ